MSILKYKALNVWVLKQEIGSPHFEVFEIYFLVNR